MRQAGQQRYTYDRATKQVITHGKRKKRHILAQVPPEIMYEWVREDWVTRGVFVDWLTLREFSFAYRAINPAGTENPAT